MKAYLENENVFDNDIFRNFLVEWMYRIYYENIEVCIVNFGGNFSWFYTKNKNIFCGQNAEIIMLKHVVQITTTGI
jgi:hypothetical protein